MKQLTKIEIENWKLYKIPGQTDMQRVKIDVIHLSIANSFEHEMKKCELAYKFMKEGDKIITEAVEISSDLRRDLINISTGETYEIENSKMARSNRHPSNINVVYYDKSSIQQRTTFEKDKSE